MRSRLYWILLGGLSFWLPPIVASATLRPSVGLWTLNTLPLAGVTLLAVSSWMATKRLPKWGWVLAGIYVLGPISMLAPSVLLHVPSSPIVPGEKTWMIVFCLFPPMTLWMAVLNGMIFSVVLATVVLPLIGAYLRGRAARL
jgi:hypothetical protein